MTAGKVLIGGTAYEIKGGKTLIGGTAYDIKGGKTLIGGTGYNINFSLPQTLEGLFSHLTVRASGGISSSPTGYVSIANANLPTGVSYLFIVGGRNYKNAGYLNIYKISYTGSGAPTLTALVQNTTEYALPYYYSSSIYFSADGASRVKTYGATMIVGTFNGYTNQEAENILTNSTYTRLARGTTGNSTTTVKATITSGSEHYVLAFYSSYMGFSYMNNDILTNYFGNYASHPSLLYLSGTTLAISLNGSSASNVYGGSIIDVSY